MAHSERTAFAKKSTPCRSSISMVEAWYDVSTFVRFPLFGPDRCSHWRREYDIILKIWQRNTETEALRRSTR